MTASAAEPTQRDNGFASAIRRPELLVAAVWLVAIPLVLLNPLSPDVQWQLWIGRHMNAGVDLYGWIMEVNPPLWFWMGSGMTWIAHLIQLDARAVTALLHWLATGISLLLCGGLLVDETPRRRALVLAAMLVLPAIVFARDFGQREHLTFIGALPYTLLIARRAGGHSVGLWTALAIGLLAAPGFALKHYLVLVPVILEGWLLWSRRSAWRPVRPETLVLVVGAAVYAAAVWLFERDYLTDMVPLVTLGYGDIGGHTLAILVSTVVLGFPAAAVYFWHNRGELSRFAVAILLAASGFAAAYFLQLKGFTNHAAPVIALVLLALVVHRVARPPRPEARSSLILAIILPVLLLAEIATAGVIYRNPHEPVVDRLLAGTQPGDTVALISVNPIKVWPMIEERKLLWPSRYFHYWMMPTVSRVAGRTGTLTPELARFVRLVWSGTVADFNCNPPDIILEDGELLNFFKQDEAFATIMSHYTPGPSEGPELGMLNSWRLTEPFPPSGSDCQPLSPRL